MTATTGDLLARYREHGSVTVPGKRIPDPHNRLDNGICGCGTTVGSIAGWAEHRHELTASGAALREHLRERNRLYGQASATIGRLRAEVARLRLECAEWRGTVNGDVLAEVLAASAPERWTPEDRRAHAEHVIEAMQASGIEVRRPVRPWTPEPGGLAMIPRPGGPEGAGMVVRIDRITEHGNVTWDSVDGGVVGASAPSALRPVPESIVDGGE